MHAFLYIGSDVVDIPSLGDVASHVQGLSFWWLDIGDPPAEAGALAAVVNEAQDAAWLTNFGHLPRFLSTDQSLRVRVPVYDAGHVREVHALLAGDRLVTCHLDARANSTHARTVRRQSRQRIRFGQDGLGQKWIGCTSHRDVVP